MIKEIWLLPPQAVATPANDALRALEKTITLPRKKWPADFLARVNKAKKAADKEDRAVEKAHRAAQESSPARVRQCVDTSKKLRVQRRDVVPHPARIKCAPGLAQGTRLVTTRETALLHRAWLATTDRSPEDLSVFARYTQAFVKCERQALTLAERYEIGRRGRALGWC